MGREEQGLWSTLHLEDNTQCAEFRFKTEFILNNWFIHGSFQSLVSLSITAGLTLDSIPGTSVTLKNTGGLVLLWTIDYQILTLGEITLHIKDTEE